MDPDDVWNIAEDFLDDFIPPDENLQLSFAFNATKNNNINNSLSSTSSPSSKEEENYLISLRSIENDDDNEQQLMNNDKNNSRLTKLLQICRKKVTNFPNEKSTTTTEISPLNFSSHDSSENRELNFSISNSLENSQELNFSPRDLAENCENLRELNFSPRNSLENREKSKELNISPHNSLENGDSSENREILSIIENQKKNHVNFSDNQKNEFSPQKSINNRENLIKNILNRTNREIISKSSILNVNNENMGKKQSNRDNLINSILKRDEKKITTKINDNNNLKKIQRQVSFIDDENENNDNEKLKKNKNYKQITLQMAMEKKSNNSRYCNDSKNNSKSKQVISRRFPGPAGLLPENIDFSNMPMAYLSSFEENETIEKLNETRISNFCSQNTKNRFTSGAWQMMIDDLPVNFFSNQDLHTIKHNAKKGEYKMKRTKFFAALIHQMDSNTIINPMIILKDSSDEIDASIHRDIFFKYPNSIEVGSVLLLNDVTIERTKFYIIAFIHWRDIVAIYNEKERIVTTKLMEKIIESQEKGGNNFDETNYILDDDDNDKNNQANDDENDEEKEEEEEEEEEAEEERNNKFLETDANGDRKKLLKNSIRETMLSTQILHNDEDNELLSQLNLDEISAFNEPRNIACSTLIGSQIQIDEDKSGEEDKKLERENTNCEKESNEKSKSSSSSKLHDYLKQFRHRENFTQSNITNYNNQSNSENQEAIETNVNNNKNNDSNSKRRKNFADDLLDSDDETINEELTTLKRITTLNSETNVVEKKRKKNSPNTSNLQNRLKQFRHSDELTQSEEIIVDNNLEEKNIEATIINREISNLDNFLKSDDEFDAEFLNINNAMEIESVINVDNNKNNELEESEDNTQNVRDEVRNFFNDPNDDEFLSQMNIDDF
ncbi:myb-like protein D [Leptopilina boulardi]|uniref:myb-like protein D n=1 Tax=Leptopilina boulardi TaxID=63433 RepID=UPI0021F53691|nr:myb-like protein D [Leptopilina boulardi]